MPVKNSFTIDVMEIVYESDKQQLDLNFKYTSCMTYFNILSY